MPNNTIDFAVFFGPKKMVESSHIKSPVQIFTSNAIEVVFGLTNMAEYCHIISSAKFFDFPPN